MNCLRSSAASVIKSLFPFSRSFLLQSSSLYSPEQEVFARGSSDVSCGEGRLKIDGVFPRKRGKSSGQRRFLIFPPAAKWFIAGHRMKDRRCGLLARPLTASRLDGMSTTVTEAFLAGVEPVMSIRPGLRLQPRKYFYRRCATGSIVDD